MYPRFYSGRKYGGQYHKAWTTGHTTTVCDHGGWIWLVLISLQRSGLCYNNKSKKHQSPWPSPLKQNDAVANLGVWQLRLSCSSEVDMPAAICWRTKNMVTMVMKDGQHHMGDWSTYNGWSDFSISSLPLLFPFSSSPVFCQVTTHYHLVFPLGWPVCFIFIEVSEVHTVP